MGGSPLPEGGPSFFGNLKGFGNLEGFGNPEKVCERLKSLAEGGLPVLVLYTAIKDVAKTIQHDGGC